MRITIRAFALGTAFCMGLGMGATFAQDASSTPQNIPPAGQEMHHGRGPMTTEQQLGHMTKALNLTSDQQTQIKPLLDARRQQMMQMHEDKSLTREDRMTKFKALDDDTHAKISAVLNDTQKTKFEKMQERRDEHMEQHSSGNMGGGQPQS